MNIVKIIKLIEKHNLYIFRKIQNSAKLIEITKTHIKKAKKMFNFHLGVYWDQPSIDQSSTEVQSWIDLVTVGPH